MTMSHQKQNITKEIQIILKKKMKILELINTVTEVKCTPDGVNSRLELTEEIISKLEDRLIEIVQA